MPTLEEIAQEIHLRHNTGYDAALIDVINLATQVYYQLTNVSVCPDHDLRGTSTVGDEDAQVIKDVYEQLRKDRETRQ